MADTPAEDSNSHDALDESGGHHLQGSSDFIDEILFGDAFEGNNVISTETSSAINSSSTLSEMVGYGSYTDSSTESITEEDHTDATLTASSANCGSDSEFYPSPAKRMRVTPVSMARGLFICETSQLQQFIDEINMTTICHTPRCTGKLVPVNVKLIGLGGAAIIKFACTGCSNRRLALHSSDNVTQSKRTVVSLALQVAFVVAGCAHSQYCKVLKQCLGISSVSSCTFYDTIKLLHPVVQNMLTEMCDEAKSEMKSLGATVVGSWQRAITTSDGVWLTRGKFSQNCSFTIRNYMNNSLLYFVHVCMRGKENDTVGGELYQGTAKGAEGYGASIAFQRAKEEGMHVEVQWQDGDSSAAKAFREHFTDETRSRVMLCGGHVARSFTKSLGEFAKQKSFSATMQDLHRKQFPDVDTVKCCCPRRHSKNCGCLSKSFIKGARTNFFYCLLHGDATKDPNAFASRLNVLGKYHARDIHLWEGDGKCDFHADVSCTCGNCEDEEDIHCSGQEYHTKVPLTCPFHALAFEIECHSRASQAKQIIHEELGRGHSNYPEASHNVLIRFRSKDKNLQRVHYIVSTNLGLLQANMSWLGKKHGQSYHWILDLFSRLKLPIFDGMLDALEKANKIRAKNLAKKQSEEAKEQRTKWKKARAQEQQERKLWSRRQRIEHTYGSDEYTTDEEGAPSTSSMQKRTRKCKCGSMEHKSIRHRSCPLNKRNREAVAHARDSDECSTDDVPALSIQEPTKKCKCGSMEHKSIRHHSCPLNKRNQEASNCYDDDDDELQGEEESDTDDGQVCTCGSARASHHRDCPLNPRNSHV